MRRIDLFYNNRGVIHAFCDEMSEHIEWPSWIKEKPEGTELYVKFSGKVWHGGNVYSDNSDEKTENVSDEGVVSIFTV